MNVDFADHVARMPLLYANLMAAPRLAVRGGAPHPKSGGIYLLFEGNQAVHVGRTRNLRVRLQSHTNAKHNSASFAFKRARTELGVVATYKPEGSRASLVQNAIFGPAFLRHVSLVGQMQVAFLEIGDPVDQYLFELYAALELGLPLDEFDTH